MQYRELDQPVRRVGVLLETFDAHPGRSGRNHLRVLALAGGIPRTRVDEVLSLVDLGQAGRRRVKGYSLGMRQRLGLAAALLGDPEVLVLDEPANGLDPQGIRWLRDFLRTLAAEGRTILVSSHVLAEVAQTVDEVVIIHRGKLVQQAAMAELEAMAAGSTTVRSPEAERLAALLAGGGPGRARCRRRTACRCRAARADRRDRSGERSRAARALGRARDARRGLPRAHRRARGARSVTRLFAAELLKLRTLRSTWGFGLVALGVRRARDCGKHRWVDGVRSARSRAAVPDRARRCVPCRDPRAARRDHPRDQRVSSRHDRADAPRDAAPRTIRCRQAPHRRCRRRRAHFPRCSS